MYIGDQGDVSCHPLLADVAARGLSLNSAIVCRFGSC